MNLQSCMGGFQCPKRGHCAWHQSEDRSDPHESLCEPGQYGAYLAINLHQVQQPTTDLRSEPCTQ